jgi:hypothetical protein
MRVVKEGLQSALYISVCATEEYGILLHVEH